MRNATIISILLIAVLTLTCEVSASDVTDTRQGILDSRFRTLQVTPEWDWMAPPVINLADPGERIVISFDELASERRYLRYSLAHCDAFWRPEGLVDSEFLDSFNEGTVDDYDYSRATVVQYVHYRITLPNSEIRITQPGNYLLRVYDEDDPDTTLLQARFGVCDFTASVYGASSPNTDIDSRQSHQQLSVRVDTRNLQVDDPFGDMRIVITQNGRPDTERVITTPQRIRGKEMIYEHMPSLIFPAGNEYRRFETVSTRFTPMGVESVRRTGPTYTFSLLPDQPRAGSPYLYDQTQHGRMRVREYDSDQSDTEAEYVDVEFRLDMPEQADGDIFIDGDLTGRLIGPESRMVYSRADRAYRQTLRLKQGAYNYQYLFVPHGSERGSTARVEGDHHETANEYVARVYARLPGDRYDRLTAVRQLVIE